MKKLLIRILNILIKIFNFSKSFIIRVLNNVNFFSKKSTAINAMYNPIFKKKSMQIYELSLELDSIKNKLKSLDNKITMLESENEIYNKKINSLTSFQIFILDNNKR